MQAVIHPSVRYDEPPRTSTAEITGAPWRRKALMPVNACASATRPGSLRTTQVWSRIASGAGDGAAVPSCAADVPDGGGGHRRLGRPEPARQVARRAPGGPSARARRQRDLLQDVGWTAACGGGYVHQLAEQGASTRAAPCCSGRCRGAATAATRSSRQPGGAATSTGTSVSRAGSTGRTRTASGKVANSSRRALRCGRAPRLDPPATPTRRTRRCAASSWP